MTPPDLISVLIPAYNAAPYLGEAIESVLAQTYRPLDVIVVDDGSDDDTAGVARAYGDRIRFASQQRGGGGSARNTAVGLARGSYFAFLDADDRFLPEKLEHQLGALNLDPELDMVFGHVREFISPELPAEAREGIRRPAEPSPWTAPNVMLVRRESFECVGPFATDLRVGETVDWYARAIDAGLKGLTLPELVLERRLHTTNTGMREPDAGLDYIRVVRASMERRRQAG
jgi:glycosyltransferase involved in cell wall biosynthesis